MNTNGLIYSDYYKFHNICLTLKSNSCKCNRKIRDIYQYFNSETEISPDITYFVSIDCRTTSNPKMHLLTKNEEIIYTAESYCDIRRYLEWSITSSIISELKELYLIHAGAVTLKDKGLIFPAESGAGKTTLVMELLKNNTFKYLSDEIAPIDLSTLRVLPFPKRLNVKGNNAIFNGYKIGEASSVDYIIFPKYCSAKKPELTKISKANAIIKILKNTLNFDAHKEKSLDILIQLVKNAECYSLTTNDLEETSNLILDLVETIKSNE